MQRVRLLISPPCENWWLPDGLACPLMIEAAESPNELPDSAISVRKVIDDLFIENRGENKVMCYEQLGFISARTEHEGSKGLH